MDKGISYQFLNVKFDDNTLKQFIKETLKTSDEVLKVIMTHHLSQKTTSTSGNAAVSITN